MSHDACEVLVLDSAIQTAGGWAPDDLPSDTRCLRLGADEGLPALVDRLARLGRPIDALHLVCHGRAGALQLGGTLHTAASLAAEPQALAPLRWALAPDAVVHLYACEAAAGPAGAALLRQLAWALDATVTGASQVVGNAEEGSNWLLDRATALPRLPARAFSAVQGTLALITGGTGNDSLAGTTGDDTLDGGAGADTLAGSLGNDTYVRDNSGDLVLENLGEGLDTVLTSVNYTLAANLERLTLTGSATNGGGNALDNALTGNALNNLLAGAAGNDTLNGGLGADTLYGGYGNDSYLIGNTETIIIEYPDQGNDWIHSSISYSLPPNVENIYLYGDARTAKGNNLNNKLFGNNADNILIGGDGSDTIDGFNGTDTAIGGLGDDLYYVEDSGDKVVEYKDEGTDYVLSTINYQLSDHVENLTLVGSATNGGGNALDNTVSGNALNNLLAGAAGSDTLDGGAGADSLYGGTGSDVYYRDNAGDVIVENAGEGSDTVYSSVNYTLAANVERLFLYGAATNGGGNALDNALIGNALNNLLAGAAGNDTLDGAAGADSLYGGTGDDVFYRDNTGDVIIENAGEGNDTVYSSFNYTLAANVENLYLSGAAANGGGNALHNLLVGNTYNNLLYGADGNDTLVGDSGNDTLNGGAGNDVVSYAAAWAAVTVNLATATASDGFGGTDSLVSIETAIGGSYNDLLVGSNGADTLIGDSGIDTLMGGAGNDSLVGGTSEDYLVGGAGNDTLDGGALVDQFTFYDMNRVSYADSPGAVSINLATGTASDGWGGTDTLLNINYVFASPQNDTLIGTTTVNIFENFEGGLGDDTIDGGTFTPSLNNANRVSYLHAPGGVTVDLAAGTASGSAGTDALANFSMVQGSDYGDLLRGSSVQTWTEFFEGRRGNDTIDGGLGRDRADYINSSGGVTVQLNWNGTGTANDGMGGTDTLISIEEVRGSNYSDLLMGSDTSSVPTGSNLEVFESLGGNDTINGGGGIDRVDYDKTAGPISVNLASGIASDGYGSIDTLIDIDSVRGGKYNDTLIGGINSETLSGNGGNDFLDGAGGNDSLLGGAGSDTLTGGAGNDTINGGAITDRLNYTDLNLVSYAGSTNAVNINLATGTASDGMGGTDSLSNLDFVVGSAFNDSIVGSSTVDLFEQFEGGIGDDTIDGGAIDELIQRNGNRVTYQNSASAVTVDLGTGTASGGGGNDALININQIRGSNFGDIIHGSNSTSLIENFDGRAGNDTIDGHGGFDMVRYESATSAVNVNLSTGIASDGQGGTDTLLNIESVRGSNYNDILIGGAVANGSGTMDGLESFLGNAGSDTINGGAGYDRVDYSSSTSGVNVQLNWIGIGTASDGLGGTDTLIDIEGVRGSAFSDTLIGSNTTDFATTGEFELFEGREGNDTIDGRGGADGVVYEVSTSAVYVDLAAGTASDGYGGIDTLINIEFARGSAFNDRLIGSIEDNRLNGKLGNDTLTGGAGNDTFVFDTGLDAAANVDQITDFTAGDLISLDNDVFIALGAAGALSAGQFTASAGVLGGSGGIYYDSNTGDLYYDSDGAGAAAAIKFATMTTPPSLSTASFEIRD